MKTLNMYGFEYDESAMTDITGQPHGAFSGVCIDSDISENLADILFDARTYCLSLMETAWGVRGLNRIPSKNLSST